MTKQLFTLALGGLGLGSTEFVVMGLLPDISNDINISIPQAGHIISSYALGVVVGAPLLVAFSSKFSPKNVLIVFMILFTIFNFFASISYDYETLMISRFFAGLPHGAFFGVGAVVATKLVKKGKEAQAISSMFTGLTLANLVMVPFLTYLGHNFNWRYAFSVITLIGLLTIVLLYYWLPKQNSLKTVTFKEELEFFKTKKAWHILAIVTIGFSGLFAWFSYIAPLLINVSHFDKASISYLMIVAGAGMVVGNILGGYLTDKVNPIKLLIILLSMMLVALLLIYLFSHIQIISILLTFICGALALSIISPINIIMLSSAKNSQMLGAAFLQAAFNLANSLGAFLGGIPLVYGLTYNYPSLVGSSMIFIGLIFCMFFLKYQKVTNNNT